ncbi:MAG: stage III sporulation protein AG [Eubacteriales bacterium]
MIGLVGIILLVMFIPTNEKEVVRETEIIEIVEESSSVVLQDDQVYVEALEQRLEAILSAMDGAGAVSVMITLDSTYEQVLQKDTESELSNVQESDASGGSRTTSESSSSQVTIYEENAQGEKVPYVIKMNTPKISGVFVVAQGGGNDTVCKNITDVIQALFGIDAHKIKVVKMK